MTKYQIQMPVKQNGKYHKSGVELNFTDDELVEMIALGVVSEDVKPADTQFNLSVAISELFEVKPDLAKAKASDVLRALGKVPEGVSAEAVAKAMTALKAGE